MHGTLWNAIFTSLIASEIDVIDTLRFNNDVDYLYRLATLLEMRLNHEYWCEPECTCMANEQYQQNSHKWETWQLGFQTLERYWASFQVTRLFHSATNFFNQTDYWNEGFCIFFYIFIYLFIFLGGGGGVISSNAFTIWCCILISRSPRVIKRFKRRSCHIYMFETEFKNAFYVSNVTQKASRIGTIYF